MANVELAKKIAAAIKAKPKLWDQRKWAVAYPEWLPEQTTYVSIETPKDLTADSIVEGSCGTTMCLAGWACHLSGRKIDWTKGEVDFGDRNQFVATDLVGGGGIEETAQELLHLTDEEASHLFYALDNERAWRLLNQIIDHGSLVDPWLTEDDE